MTDYRVCMALFNMADTYTPQRLEAACVKALCYTPRPAYKAIQTILKSSQAGSPASLPPRLNPPPTGLPVALDTMAGRASEMLDNNTVQKLHEMKLSVMAAAFQKRLAEAT
jgi:hypothetical protein